MEAAHSVQELAFAMGEMLLKNGAEISRVQETMERVARAYKLEDFNAYVLTNAIFVNATGSDGRSETTLKQLSENGIHLGRICAVNQLSREIARGKYSVDEAFSRLGEIEAIPYSSLPLRTLACGVGSAAYSYLFGGNGRDALAAFFCGLLLEPFLHLLEKRGISRFLVNLLSSAFVALLGSLFVMFGIGSSLDKVVIGSIIRLVPGIALTTSIRDFFNRDYLSGTIRMIDALLVGGCIAVGVGVVLKIMSLLTGGALL